MAKKKNNPHPFIALIAGKSTAGKTTSCINRIKKAILENKKLKQVYRIVVVTDLPNEYAKLKPLKYDPLVHTNETKLLAFKNNVLLLPSHMAHALHSFRDGLIVFDCNIKILPRDIHASICTSKHFDRSIFITTPTLSDVPPALFRNINYIELFTTADNYDHPKFGDERELLELASHCVHQANFYRKIRSVIVNLKTSKITVSEAMFFMGAEWMAAGKVKKRTIKELMAFGARVQHYAKYYQQPEKI